MKYEIAQLTEVTRFLSHPNRSKGDKPCAFHEVSHEIITVIAADASQGVLGLHEPINRSLPLLTASVEVALDPSAILLRRRLLLVLSPCKALLLVLSLVQFILAVLLLGIVIRLLLLDLNSEIASSRAATPPQELFVVFLACKSAFICANCSWD